MLSTLAAFLLAIAVLVTLHELGHYAVARWCGVRILRFSVGFGRVLFSRYDRHGTEWAVSWIPLGGYVRMLDTPDLSPGSDRSATFSAQSVGRRMAIVLAGPAANLLLAVLLYAGLALGVAREPAAILAEPAAGTPAALAGVESGDRILTIQGQPVQSWLDARFAVLAAVAAREPIDLEIERLGVGRLQLQLDSADLPAGRIEGDLIPASGLALKSTGARVQSVTPGSAAEQGGLLAGDRIIGLGATNPVTVTEFINVVRSSPGAVLALQLDREGALLDISIRVPEVIDEATAQRIGRIGVQLTSETEWVEVHRGPIAALGQGVQRTWDLAVLSLGMLGRMIVGDISWQNLSGPVTIADYAGQSARMGLTAFIGFLALVSVSLGVLNLLPIPTLDGGHLLYHLIEVVRGSPPPDRWIELGHRAGLTLIMGFTALALFNDFSRLLG